MVRFIQLLIVMFVKTISEINVLNGSKYFTSFEIPIKNKSRKTPAFIYFIVNLIIRLPALITLRCFRFLQDRQEVQ